jgi:hypothetical protein
MSEDAQNELVLWEYKWSGGDLNEMNRLGREGWEAIGTNSIAKALVFGATVPPSVSVLYKRRYFAKPPRENDAGRKLKQLLEEERAQKKRSKSGDQNEKVICLNCKNVQEGFYTFCKKCHGESFQILGTD